VEDLSSEMEGDNLSTKNTDKQIQWRRTKVLELSSQGNTQSDIAKTLHVGEATVSRDISSLREQAQLNLKTHINDKLPEEYQNCMTGINQVLKICWEIVNKSRSVNNDNGQTVTMTDNKTVLQALALINDCNKYKMDLTTNGVVITDAIKFVKTNKEKLTTMSTKEEDNGSKESTEPDYVEDENKLEEKETGEQETANQTF
jgi:predicted transcriptional regulator